MVERRKYVWTRPWVLYRSCNTNPQGRAPAIKVVYLHALFAPETFAPVSCNPQRTGSSRAALVLSSFAFLSSVGCHLLRGAETRVRISAPLRQQPSIWKCGSQGSTCSTPAGLGLCRAEPKTLVKLFIQCYCHTSFFKGVRSETTSADPSLSTTNFMNHFQACQMSAMWTGVITLGAALAEELSHTLVLAVQDYGWFLGGGDIRDIRVNAVMVWCGLELHKLHKGEK